MSDLVGNPEDWFPQDEAHIPPNKYCTLISFQEKSSEKYGLVLVGHSLGAGTAAILAIMLQQEYTDLHCYSYSPPGGLLR